MKKFLTLLSASALFLGAYTNNLFAQDMDEDGTIIITAEDEEYCPFCNAIAAAQASNSACLIVIQAPDGSTQMTNCPPPASCKKGDKKCMPCPPCPKCKSPKPAPSAKTEEAAIATSNENAEEVRADKALAH